MSPSLVTIQYRRLPDRERTFHQTLVGGGEGYRVTLLAAAPVERPSVVGDVTILDPGAPIVWFTYPGEWYDIGRFHRVDGTFTGFYANILTPVEMNGGSWRTTDLCLDVWSGTDGQIQLLDEDEFTHAVHERWIDTATAERARETATALVASAAAGSWPPPHVHEWTLERALACLSEGR